MYFSSYECRPQGAASLKNFIISYIYKPREEFINRIQNKLYTFFSLFSTQCDRYLPANRYKKCNTKIIAYYNSRKINKSKVLSAVTELNSCEYTVLMRLSRVKEKI